MIVYSSNLSCTLSHNLKGETRKSTLCILHSYLLAEPSDSKSTVIAGVRPSVIAGVRLTVIARVRLIVIAGVRLTVIAGVRLTVIAWVRLIVIAGVRLTAGIIRTVIARVDNEVLYSLARRAR